MITLERCTIQSVLGRELPQEHFENGIPVVLLAMYHGDHFFLPRETKVLPSAEVYRGESVVEGIRRAFTSGLGFARRDIPTAPWEVLGCLEDSEIQGPGRRVILLRYMIPEVHPITSGLGVPGDWKQGSDFMAMLSEIVPTSVFLNSPEETRLAA